MVLLVVFDRRKGLLTCNFLSTVMSSVVGRSVVGSILDVEFGVIFVDILLFGA